MLSPLDLSIVEDETAHRSEVWGMNHSITWHDVISQMYKDLNCAAPQAQKTGNYLFNLVYHKIFLETSKILIVWELQFSMKYINC